MPGLLAYICQGVPGMLCLRFPVEVTKNHKE